MQTEKNAFKGLVLASTHIFHHRALKLGNEYDSIDSFLLIMLQNVHRAMSCNKRAINLQQLRSFLRPTYQTRQYDLFLLPNKRYLL